MIDRRSLLIGGLAGLAASSLNARTTGTADMKTPRLVMWGAALMAHPLQTRLDAVATIGFTHMTVFPANVKKWRRDGLSDAGITKAIRASGVQIAAIDPYTGWVPGWSMDGLDEFTRDFIDVSEDDVFRMADILETGQINLVESAGAAYDETTYAEAMNAFAERAIAHGLKPTFEFMPTSKIEDINKGWSLIQASGADVGLTFDIWHFWRSNPDFDLLKTIPPDRISEVKIADGKNKIVEDLQTDLLFHRKVPGEGDFDLQHTIDVLRDMGPIRSIGPETFSL